MLITITQVPELQAEGCIYWQYDWQEHLDDDVVWLAGAKICHY